MNHFYYLIHFCTKKNQNALDEYCLRTSFTIIQDHTFQNYYFAFINEFIHKLKFFVVFHIQFMPFNILYFHYNIVQNLNQVFFWLNYFKIFIYHLFIKYVH